MRYVAFLLLLITVTRLTGCGLSPVYGERSTDLTSTGSREELPFALLGDGSRLSQLLLLQLEHSGVFFSDNPRYLLSVSFDEQLIPASIEQDGSISRFTMLLNSSYQIRPAEGEGDALLRSARLRTYVGYNAIEDEFPTYLAQQDARERAVGQLAEQYRYQLFSFLESQQEAP